MIATTTKLRELAATKWSSDDRAVLDADGFEILITSVRGDLSNLAKAALAPTLARLVLEQQAVLEAIAEGRTLVMDDLGQTFAEALQRDAQAALAAVEEL